MWDWRQFLSGKFLFHDNSIHIIEISDLSDIVQTDFNYQYEDWDDILVSDLESLSLESTQKHTTATASSDFREYDNQSFTFKTTLSTSDSTPEVLICISELTVEFTTEFQIRKSHITDSSSHFINKQSIFADD